MSEVNDLALEVGSGGVPAGAYQAEFIGVEVQPANPEKKYDEGLRWKWKVKGGLQDGQVASRITGKKPSPRNACGRILSGLLGRALAEGEKVQVGPLVGRTYLVVVASTPNGGTRVDNCVLAQS
jgi:hypothetical protein